MANEIHDQYHGDPTLVTLLGSAMDRPAMYDYIKSASFTQDKIANLPPSAYAWEEKRRFPIHSAEDTVASLVYRAKCAHHVPADVDARLAQAVEAYGIPDTLFQTANVKVASAELEPEYAVPSQKRLPLGSPSQIKLAEEVLLRDKDRLDIETAVDAFCRLEKAASLAKVALDTRTHLYAGSGSCDTSLLRDALDMRQGATRNPELRAGYAKLASALPQGQGRIRDRDTLVKLAGRIHDMDMHGGLEGHYGKRLVDPIRSVFNVPPVGAPGEKRAADQIDMLMRLPVEIWAQVDVPEMAELAQSGDRNTFAQVWETLPADIKMIIQKQMG